VSDRTNLETRVALERRVLQCFCTGNIPEPLAAGLQAKLATYMWHDEENQVVFECLKYLTSTLSLTPSQLREQLPAQATRMGFPDVNWEDYLTVDKADCRDVGALVRELLAA
jgi:hypothetical protein